MDIAWRPRAPHGLTWRLPGRPRAADAVLAAGLVLAFSEPGFDPYHHDSGTVWAAVGVLGAAALAWRRVSPRIVWLIATATGTWVLVMRHGPDWGGLSPLVLIPSSLIALYTLTSRMTGRGGLLATAGTLAALEAGLLCRPVRPEAVAMTAALAVCAWVAGEGASARTRALRAERVARDLRAAAEERARIARELHDGPARGETRTGARVEPRAGEADGGHGLRGLRERVAAHGGTFRAGPRDGDGAGGFEVLATLPVPESAADSDGAR